MSAKIGRAPTRMIELAVAKKEKGVVRTSSPGPIRAAASARKIASVPDAQPTVLAPRNSDARCSNSVTALPRMYCWESQTRSIAAKTSTRIWAYCREKSSMGTDISLEEADGVLARVVGRDTEEGILASP